MYSAYVTHVQSMAVEVFTAFTPIIPEDVLTTNTGVTLTTEDFLLDETTNYALDDGFGSYLVSGLAEDLLATLTLVAASDFSPTDFSPVDFSG